MSVKHAILGVLMQCPSHGYRIKKLFAPFVSRDGLNDGQVYPILNRLEQENLVRKETVHQKKSPTKNIYHITDRGKKEFMRWLVGSADEVDPVRYDFFMQYRFLMKCNFFEHLPPEERMGKLKRQIAAAEKKIAEYVRVRDDMLERGLNDYKIRIVTFGIDMQSLKIQWIKDLMKSEQKRGPHGTAQKKKSQSAQKKNKAVARKG